MKSFVGSYGSLRCSSISEPIDDELVTAVYPSGSALAAVAKPLAPPAPGRGSITIGCPIRCDTSLRTTRDTVSAALPAGNGLITRICRVGYCSARTAAVAAMRIAPARAQEARSDNTKLSRIGVDQASLA